VCAELDGLLIADSQEKEFMLVTVEAKHKLKRGRYYRQAEEAG
jgi:hypothetical protein